MVLYSVTSNLTSKLRWAMLGLPEKDILCILNDMIYALYVNENRKPFRGEIISCVDNTFSYAIIDVTMIDDFISRYSNEDLMDMLGFDKDPDSYSDIQFGIIDWLKDIFINLLLEVVSLYGELFIDDNYTTIKKIYTIDVDRYIIGI